MLALLLTFLFTEPAISVRATPAFQLVAPGKSASLQVAVRIPHHPDNRAVCLYVDGPTYSQSCWQHGPDSPLQTLRWVYGLSGGVYRVGAAVQQTTQTVDAAWVNVCVIEAGEEC